MALTIEQFGKALAASGLMTPDDVRAFWNGLPAETRPKTAEAFAQALVEKKLLTDFQAKQILAGRGGSLVMGDYAILAEIGAGGMGQVYKARHRRMERIVALKVMSSAAMKDEAAVKRFQREVRAAAKLEHPNIVTAYDSGEAGKVKYLVMQFVDGGDLSSLVKAHGPLPIEKAVDYVLQAARGLAFAHGEGVIHRDIKPANLLVDKKGVVKILDMGLARIESGDDGLTATEQVMGTVDYMSPEQAANTKGADGRADIYSLGCTLWYLLTGKKAYEADTMIARLMAHRDAPLPSLVKTRDDAPWALEQALHKMLAKRPQDRYQSMDEVVAALEPFGGGGGSSKGPMGSSIGMGSQTNAELAAFLQSVGPKTTGATGLGVTQPGAAPKSATNVGADATAAFLRPEADTDPKSQILPKSQSLPKPGAKVVKQKRPPVKLIAGGLLGAALLLIAGILIVIKNKDGDVVAELNVPEGATVEVRSAPVQASASPAGSSNKVAAFLESADYLWSTPENLGPNVNTSGGEFGAALSADELCLIYHGDGASGGESNLWECRRASIDQPFGPRRRLTGSAYEFDASVSADGLTLLYETHAVPAGRVAKDIRIRTRTTRDAPWSNPVTLDLDADHDDQTPWISDDGLTLIFSSNRPGTLGPADIWLARRNTPDAPFTQVTRLGNGVNTQSSEQYGRILADGRTIQFVRDGKPFLTFTSANGVTTALPLRDVADDVRVPWLSADGHRMYFHSDRPGSFGGSDLWISRRVPKSSLPDSTQVAIGPPSNPYALEFDGTEQAFIDPLEIDLGKPLTIEGYFRPQGTAAEHGRPFLGFIRTFSMNWSAQTLRPMLAVGHHQNLNFPYFQIVAETPPPADRDVHYAAVWAPPQVRFYVDGKLVGSRDVPAQPSNPKRAAAVICERLRARADEIRISQTARYTSDFTPPARFEPDAATLCLFHCDEGKSTLLTDASGSRLNIPFQVAKWVPGEARVGPVGAGQVASAAPSSSAAADGWTALFNGRDLSGWRQLGHPGWRVEGDELIGTTSGSPGWLQSDSNWGDFELGFEYRLAPESNSGVFLRAWGEGNISGKDFHEIQLLDDTAPKFAGVRDNGRNGSLYGHLAAKASRPAGPDAWHRMTIAVFGERVRVSVDGEQVLDDALPAGKRSTGHVGLQLYPHEVRFRGLRIRRLNADGAPLVPPAPATATNHALQFDGARGDVLIPGLRRDDAGPYTLECWVRNVGDGTMPVVRVNGRAPVQLHFHQRHPHGAERNEADKIGRDAIGPQLAGTDWTHLAYVVYGAESRLFVDGKSVNVQAKPAPGVAATAKFADGWIGSERFDPTATTRSFVGAIDEIRVSKTARYTPAGFTPARRHESDADTLALYHFDEGSGDVLRDSSGNGRDGKIDGAKWVRADGGGVIASAAMTTASGHALEFDGAASYVVVPTWKYQGGHPLTAEAWMFWDRPADDPKVDVLLGDPQGAGFAMTSNSGTDINNPKPGWTFGISTDRGKASATAGAAPARGRWVHVAGVYDGAAEVRFYVDGKLAARTPSQGAYRSSNVPTVIGANSDHTPQGFVEFFRGKIDEVRFSKAARYDGDFSPQRRHEPDADTLALYHFDEGAGDVLRDSSGNGRDGKIVGAKWVRADGPITDPQAVAATTIDLLKKLDVAAHAVGGKFALDGEGLRVTEGTLQARVALPVDPMPDEYDLHVAVGRLAPGGKAFVVGVPWQGSQGCVVVDGFSNPPLSGLELIDGQTPKVNGTENPGEKITFGPRNHKVVVRVRNAGIAAECDGKPLFDWKGKPSQLSTHAMWEVPRKDLPFLGFQGPYVVHGVELVPFVAKAADTAPSPNASSALQFDGTSFVEILNLPWGKLDTVTLEAWVRPDEVPADRGYVMDRFNCVALSSAVGHWQAVMHTYDGKQVQYPFVRDQTPHASGVWTHLANVVHDRTITLFVNGKKVGSTPLNAAIETRYGDGMTLGFQFACAIRGARVSKSARYTADFAPPARLAPDADTLASYDFAEGAGDVLHDTSGHNLHGKILGAKWIAVDTTTGQKPDAASETRLFETDLAGWTGDPAVWKVENGELVGTLPGAGQVYLAGDKTYKDFEASFEVRLRGDGANSGMQFRSGAQSAAPPVMVGPQAEVGAGGKTGFAGLWWQASGGRVLQAVEPAVYEKLLKPDDHNAMTVRCVGKRVTITLNGTTTVAGEFADVPPEGLLGWQLVSKGPPVEVRFRNVQVRDLSSPSAKASGAARP